MIVKVTVDRLGLDASSNSYVVVLREFEGSRVLPIWIGQPEAESIIMQMNGITPERPLTHDLCQSLIRGLGATLRRVIITRVQHNIYYAALHLDGPNGPLEVDARPSDSIAVALRLGAPMYVEAALLSTEHMDSSTTDATSVNAPPRAPFTPEELKSHLQHLRPEDFGKFTL